MTKENMSEDRYYQVGDGMPTSPDVEALLMEWPEPAVGTVFTYDRIEELIGSTRESVRFWTVTDKWRERLRDERQVVTYCNDGEAFYVPTPAEVIADTAAAMRASWRKLERQRESLLLQHPENELQREQIAHRSLSLHVLARQIRKEGKQLTLPSTLAHDLPRITPPDHDRA